MPRDASGTYSLPQAPFQPQTVARSALVNSNFSDIATALTDSYSVSVGQPQQGDLNMNGHAITNLGGDLSTTGTVTIGGNAVSTPELTLNGAAGTGRNITGETAGQSRWFVVLGDTAAESGANAGSNFGIFRYDDSGTYLGQPFAISRATGQATFAQPLTASAGISTTTIAASGAVTAASVGLTGNLNCAAIGATGFINAGGTITAPTVAASGAVTAASVSATGNVTVGGSLTTSGTVTGTIAAKGNGTQFPDLAQSVTGQPSHSFGYVWDGSSISVYVDGSYLGRMAINTPLAEEMEARLQALEARLAALEAA